MKRKRRISGKLAGALAAAAVIIVVLVILGIRSGARNGANAVPKQITASYEESYGEYLEANGFEGMLSDSEVTVNLEKFTLSADMTANIGEQGILTEDSGTITWEFQVADSGFYNIELDRKSVV